jgi:hypothetical protein
VNEKELIEFSNDPNFSYLYPKSSPKETEPYTTIIEFKMDEGTYQGYFSGHAELIDKPKS